MLLRNLDDQLVEFVSNYRVFEDERPLFRLLA